MWTILIEVCHADTEDVPGEHAALQMFLEKLLLVDTVWRPHCSTICYGS